MKTPIAAVILAAGKGTRMKSDRAKVLHEACGRPIAFYPVKAALTVDCAPAVVVVGHQAEAVEQQLAKLFAGSTVKFALQKEQLGTGHAVLCAKAALEQAGFGDRGSILILAGDTPLVRPETLAKLIAAKAAFLVQSLQCSREIGGHR